MLAEQRIVKQGRTPRYCLGCRTSVGIESSHCCRSDVRCIDKGREPADLGQVFALFQAFAPGSISLNRDCFAPASCKGCDPISRVLAEWRARCTQCEWWVVRRPGTQGDEDDASRNDRRDCEPAGEPKERRSNRQGARLRKASDAHSIG